MGGSDPAPASHSTQAPTPDRPSASPALVPRGSPHRQDSYSSASADRSRYSFSTSAHTSPALGPGAYECARGPASVASTLTSPALGPQRDMDQEATAALLMLNTDRRGTLGSVGGSGRGMSVRDLLST